MWKVSLFLASSAGALGAVPVRTFAAAAAAARKRGGGVWARRRRKVDADVMKGISEEATRLGESVKLSDIEDDNIRRVLSFENAGLSEVRRQKRRGVIDKYGRGNGDTGSPEAQIAILTFRMRELADHTKLHRKDYNAKRKLEAMLNTRRKMLKYLSQRDYAAFTTIMSELNIPTTALKAQGEN